MIIKCKYNQGDRVYYIWTGYLGSDKCVIGEGVIEKIVYDSGWKKTTKYPYSKRHIEQWKNLKFEDPDAGIPRYCIRRGGADWIIIPEHHVFKTYRKTRTYIKEQKIPFFWSKLLRMREDKLMLNSKT